MSVERMKGFMCDSCIHSGCCKFQVNYGRCYHNVKEVMDEEKYDSQCYTGVECLFYKNLYKSGVSNSFTNDVMERFWKD